MLGVILLLIGAALAAYRLVQELRVDTGVLEIALIATVAQLVGAEAGYFRLRGGDVLAVILLAFQFVFWVILGARVFFFDVLPWHGGFGLPAHDLNVVLLVALVAAALGLVLLYRAAFRTLLPLRRTPTSQAD
jgi:hypothetical protein